MKAKLINLALVVALCGGSAARAQDPLPSWNDTAPKKAIIDFVERVTKEDWPDFVKPEERIASFDNDGTLWAEQPIYFQVLFMRDRVKAFLSRRSVSGSRCGFVSYSSMFDVRILAVSVLTDAANHGFN
jgi:hypothetical protein